MLGPRLHVCKLVPQIETYLQLNSPNLVRCYALLVYLLTFLQRHLALLQQQLTILPPFSVNSSVMYERQLKSSIAASHIMSANMFLNVHTNDVA